MLRCLGSVLGPTCTRPAQAGETCICNGRTSPRARERVGSSPVSWIGPRSSRDPTSWEAAAKSEMVVGAGFGRRLTEDIRDRRAVPRLESGCGSLRSPSGSSRALSRARRSLRTRSRRDGGLLAEAASAHIQAATIYAEAAERWREFGNVPERAYALLGQARCLVALDRREAETLLRETRDLFATMGNKPALAEVEALLTQTAAAPAS
jgi:hypothetical protein